MLLVERCCCFRHL